MCIFFFSFIDSSSHDDEFKMEGIYQSDDQTLFSFAWYPSYSALSTADTYCLGLSIIFQFAALCFSWVKNGSISIYIFDYTVKTCLPVYL